jgi:hypothetical protein
MQHIVLFILFFLCGNAVALSAQDTFYVKKKTKPVIAQRQQVFTWDSTNTDSIVSYTLEYQKPNSTIWVKLHQQGPYIVMPHEVYGSGRRVLITDIIAIDANGRRYRQPDRYWINGLMVPVAPAKK